MAEPWIKSRSDLARDPKVIMMIDTLTAADPPPDGPGDAGYGPVHHARYIVRNARSVLRYAVAGALGDVWGVVRVRGKPVGADAVIPGAGLAVVDELVNLPEFGRAMAAVGWAVATPDGLLFPSFFGEYNRAPEDARRTTNAARQKRYRERRTAAAGRPSGGVTGDVSGDAPRTQRSDGREEKSSKKKYPPNPPKGEGRKFPSIPRTIRRPSPNRGDALPPALIRTANRTPERPSRTRERVSIRRRSN